MATFSITPSTFNQPSGQGISYSLSYVDEPKRPTVLLANPLGAHHCFWDRIVSELHAAGYRVLRFDQPGHGDSGVPSDLSSTTFNSIASGIHALLTSPDVTDSFAGLNSPGALTPSLHAWIGVSMGAALGVVFATNYPGMVRSLVICDTITCSPVNAGVEDLFGPRVAAARQDGDMCRTSRETMARWFGETWIISHAAEAARLLGLMERTTIDGYETCCAALRSETFDLQPLVGKLGSSVEHVRLVVGEKDADLPVTMKKLQEGTLHGFQQVGKPREIVELYVIPNAGHVSFIDGEEAWLNAVMPFLKE